MVLFDGSTIRDSDMNGVTMRGVGISDTSIDGEFNNLVLNGVDVAPIIEAELDRRDPDRPKFRPTTPDGFREAWDVNERRWAATVYRARQLPPERLHESVGGEWSFVQTLRHLAFASESWVGRAVLGDPYPWHPMLLRVGHLPRPGHPAGPDARPSLDEALAIRQDAMALVRRVVDDLDEAELARDRPVRRAGLAAGRRHVLGPRLPAHRAQRGVAPPGVRRAGPGRARVGRLRAWG